MFMSIWFIYNHFSQISFLFKVKSLYVPMCRGSVSFLYIPPSLFCCMSKFVYNVSVCSIGMWRSVLYTFRGQRVWQEFLSTQPFQWSIIELGMCQFSS